MSSQAFLNKEHSDDQSCVNTSHIVYHKSQPSSYNVQVEFGGKELVESGGKCIFLRKQLNIPHLFFLLVFFFTEDAIRDSASMCII